MALYPDPNLTPSPGLLPNQAPAAPAIYGYVVGRLLSTTAAPGVIGPADVDVVLVPAVPLAYAQDDAGAAAIVYQRLLLQLDQNGYLLGPDGTKPAKLPVGTWSASVLGDGKQISTTTFELTAANTALNPIDLANELPFPIATPSERVIINEAILQGILSDKLATAASAAAAAESAALAQEAAAQSGGSWRLTEAQYDSLITFINGESALAETVQTAATAAASSAQTAGSAATAAQTAQTAAEAAESSSTAAAAQSAAQAVTAAQAGAQAAQQAQHASDAAGAASGFATSAESSAADATARAGNAYDGAASAAAASSAASASADRAHTSEQNAAASAQAAQDAAASGGGQHGPSLPTGGTRGQVLRKNSATDGDAAFANAFASPQPFEFSKRYMPGEIFTYNGARWLVLAPWSSDGYPGLYSAADSPSVQLLPPPIGQGHAGMPSHALFSDGNSAAWASIFGQTRGTGVSMSTPAGATSTGMLSVYSTYGVLSLLQVGAYGGSYPIRVRGYRTDQDRTTDLGRPAGTAAPTTNGPLFDVVLTTASQLRAFTPGVTFLDEQGQRDTAATSNIYIAVDNPNSSASSQDVVLYMAQI